ncbi:MAG: terminase [Planctomycetes bacterium]|nr:hypothetical protein [Pontiellaceae bacterium]MBN2711899.1 terminase [Planctomycetota bacterium]
MTDDLQVPQEILDDAHVITLPNGRQVVEFPNTLHNKVWRMNNLYYIKDKESRRVLFKCNWAQEEMLRNRHDFNLVLKARQLGCTTFWVLYMEDEAIWTSNMRCVLIAHDKDSGQEILEDKVKYAWDNLPRWCKERMLPFLYGGSFTSSTDTKDRLRFSNNSFVRVTLSSRSGTCNILHISEFGKICAKYPDKAKEIVTGALESVAAGQTVIIESTAEGQSGYFFQYSMKAIELVEREAELTRMDWKLFFFPWWREPGYMLTLDEARVTVIPKYLDEYFDKLKAEHGIELLPEQKAWYVKKLEKMQTGEDESGSGDWDDMKREYPSYPREAFEQSVKGAYYNTQFTRIHKECRIGSFPYRSGYLVDTWWDIGVGDHNSIWFTQTIGNAVNVVDFYQNSGEGLQHYVQKLQELRQEHGYIYGRMVAPHDIMVREWSNNAQTRYETARKLGIQFEIAPKLSLEEGIDAVRRILGVCRFDEAHTDEGVKALKAYRKEWDKSAGVWKNRPLHNWASHPADAFRTLAVAHRFDVQSVVPQSVIDTMLEVGAGAWS